ncbi:hypothetical protein Bca52824_075329 [Brassica carinata]|uniref:Uncharacterized protein n=1 Tax=Brassica carinata TaxID=52824 RepID=A0A8X7TVB5_BRACI|nr:hypothetical protein Bca52824_075329 [Brassica carinata]
MEEEEHGQALEATLSRHFAALQKLKNQTALLEKRNKAQGQHFTSSEIQELYPRRYPTHGSKEARKIVAQEGQRVLPQQDYFQPNQGHAIVHCFDQKSDIPEAMKMSKSVGQNTLIRSKEKQEHATMQVKAKGYQMRVICLLRLQGPNQNMSSIKIHTTSGNRNLNKRLFKLMNLSCPKKSEIIAGNQGEYKAKKEQEVLAATTDLRVNCSICFDPGISQEEHKNRTELSKEGDHTNQDRKLQERQPPNQTCPKKNIILHHAKASKVYNLHSIHIAHPIISLVDPSKLPSSISSTLIPSLQHLSKI